MPDLSRAGHLPPFKRVGHKGADLVTPGNTFESFAAALDLRVDMIEFDVLRLPEGRLVLAHDLTDATERTPPTLAEGLDHFAGEAYAGVELDVDLKLPGYEREVVEGIVARDLTGRVLISSQYTESLVEIGRLEPRIRRGWSVPKVRRDYTRSWLAPAAYAVLQVMRRRLPAQAAALIGAGGAEALMAHHLLVSGRLVDAVRGAG
ncbi:MAG: glycerophosphoryl diester phosphodiesterase, partial [Thermoleophilaceae bacterium]|nr:glycerophosphoryl diester phosphodiesterase [Thermoleophilaceae bacterium]